MKGEAQEEEKEQAMRSQKHPDQSAAETPAASENTCPEANAQAAANDASGSEAAPAPYAQPDRSTPPRLRVPDRQQLLSPKTIDELLEAGHPARAVWSYVEGLDLTAWYDRIRARGHVAGRPAIDPRLLVALWLYATLCGYSSAREIANLCIHHDAFRWLCGGISVNYHTLADFRTDHSDFLDSLLKQSVEVLRQQGLIDLDRVAQDGMRVRASAGAASFRSRETLERLLREAEAKVQQLQQQLHASTPKETQASQEPGAETVAAESTAATASANQEPKGVPTTSQEAQANQEPPSEAADVTVPQEVEANQPAVAEPAIVELAAPQQAAASLGAVAQENATTQGASQETPAEQTGLSGRQLAARYRHAKERVERLQAALARMPEMEAKKEETRKKLAQKKAAGQRLTRKEEQNAKARVSSTDPQATVMKMADGGYRPAYNVQYNTACKGMVIVGVDVSTEGSDQGQLPPMLDQIEERFKQRPKEALVDGGVADHEDIEKLQSAEKPCKVYAPVPEPKKEGVDRYEAKKTDSKEVAEWRQRMGTEQAKTIYKQRGATAECVNAQARNRGMLQFTVRGLQKIKAIATWFAAAHNMARSFALSTATGSG